MAGTICAIIVLIFVGIQFIPVTLSNPPVESDISTPPEVKSILKVSCYDCHSHETIWPWYSKMAPVSWLLAADAGEGREKMNFSTWNKYDPEKQRRLIAEAMDEVRGGNMPPWFYILKHPDAKISPGELKILEAWSAQYRGSAPIKE